MGNFLGSGFRGWGLELSGKLKAVHRCRVAWFWVFGLRAWGNLKSGSSGSPMTSQTKEDLAHEWSLADCKSVVMTVGPP